MDTAPFELTLADTSILSLPSTAIWLELNVTPAARGKAYSLHPLEQSLAAEALTLRTPRGSDETVVELITVHRPPFESTARAPGTTVP